MSVVPSGEDIDMVLEFVQPQVTVEMSKRLDRLFNEIEVQNALWQMHPNKLQGPDGFSSLFFFSKKLGFSGRLDSLSLSLYSE